jgi:hypothetical protein
MIQQGMSSIVDALSLDNTWELIRVIWMEVAIACFAGLVYFTMTAVLSPQIKKSGKSGKKSG